MIIGHHSQVLQSHLSCLPCAVRTTMVVYVGSSPLIFFPRSHIKQGGIPTLWIYAGEVLYRGICSNAQLSYDKCPRVLRLVTKSASRFLLLTSDFGRRLKGKINIHQHSLGVFFLFLLLFFLSSFPFLFYDVGRTHLITCRY